MKTLHSRHNGTNDWHIKCANDLWKVYDRDQKYRCSFRTRTEAEHYIDQHRTRRPKGNLAQLAPRNSCCWTHNATLPVQGHKP